ncbi:unnamed protein product [Polarella glacialis]|uniref:Uncharacterized protein n=1 Tax=Polarella glacialis TaxID=89957 RepID=A0A813HZ06_POLGL|nr:unnamed protein product [Polarella glacialis]CAE8714052.1 unnamed protein product [Polarella glacialis]
MLAPWPSPGAATEHSLTHSSPLFYSPGGAMRAMMPSPVTAPSPGGASLSVSLSPAQSHHSAVMMQGFEGFAPSPPPAPTPGAASVMSVATSTAAASELQGRAMPSPISPPAEAASWMQLLTPDAGTPSASFSASMRQAEMLAYSEVSVTRMETPGPHSQKS